MTSPPPPTESQPRPVAFCITELDPGGAERALVETVVRLDRSDWSPHVYCLGPETPLAGRLREAGVGVTCFSATTTNALGTTWALRRAFKQQRPAVVMTSLFHANIVGRIAATGLGVPVIAGHRVAERASGWHLRLERLTGRFVDHHVAVSESVRQFLISERVTTAERSSVIYNGVDIERFASAEAASFEAAGPVVLFVGRLHPQKGIEILIEAWRNVTAVLPAAQLVFAGDGPLRPTVEQAADVTESIHTIGFQSDIARWYRRADLLVLPSLWEGLPNVVLEAVAAGTPCVVSDVEGVREIFPDDSGQIVPPGDASALAAAIVTQLSGGEDAIAAFKEAQTYVQETFTWERTASDTAQLMARMIDTTKTSAASNAGSEKFKSR